MYCILQLFLKIQNGCCVPQNSKWRPKCHFFDQMMIILPMPVIICMFREQRIHDSHLWNILYCCSIPETSNLHPIWRIFQQSYDNVVILLFSSHLCWVFMIISIIPYPIVSSLYLIAIYQLLNCRAVASLTVLSGQEFHFPHFFPQTWNKFSYFSSDFTYFLPNFGPPGGLSTREDRGYVTA